MNCEAAYSPAGAPFCRHCQQPGDMPRECPRRRADRPPRTDLTPVEIADLLPGLSDPTLIGNRIETAMKKLGIPPCDGCGNRRDWLNAAHAYLREVFAG